MRAKSKYARRRRKSRVLQRWGRRDLCFAHTFQLSFV